MADLSKIKLNGDVYNFKDTAARQAKNVWFATCSTDADIQNKQATTTTGDFVLAEGNSVKIKMGYGCLYPNPKLSVDGCTYKPIVYKGSSSAQGMWDAQEIIEVVYNGSYFVILNGKRATTSSYGITKLSSNYSSSATDVAATSAAVKVAYDLAASKVALADIPLASQTTNGLLSAVDKTVLDSLNPNVTVTIDNISEEEIHIINAKQENMLSLEIIETPTIGAQIRTSNLLNVNEYTPGYYISSNGSTQPNTNDHLGEFIPVSPGDDIYYTGIIGPSSSSSINRRLHVYKSDMTWIKQISFAGSLHEGDHWSTHGVVPSNGAYIRVSWGANDTHVMLSLGAPSNYEPYYITPFTTISSLSFEVSADDTYTDADTYTVNFPAAAGDIYSCVCNPIEGKLYVNTGHIASYNGETLTTQWWSDRDIYGLDETPSTGAEVVYVLDDADVEEYDLTPVVVPLNFRINYIRPATGNITLLSYYAATLAANHFTVYDAVTFGDEDIFESDIVGWKHAADVIDTKADIDSPIFTGIPQAPTANINVNSDRLATTAFVQTKMNNIAKVEPSSRASKNYSVGDYLFMGGQLFKVTASIAQSGTITAGTNVEATTVMGELGSQNSDILLVHVNVTLNSGGLFGTGTADKTFNEIQTAYNNGKIIFAIYEGNVFSLAGVTNSAISFAYIPDFQSTYGNSRDGFFSANLIYRQKIIFNSNGSIEYERNESRSRHSNSDWDEIIVIVDENGAEFQDANDLTTSTTFGIADGFYVNDEPIFYEHSKVRVGNSSEDSSYLQTNETRSCEMYDLAKYEISQEEIIPESQQDDPWTKVTYTGTFRTLSIRNNNPVLKTITISYSKPLNDYIDFEQPIVSYSEIVL